MLLVTYETLNAVFSWLLGVIANLNDCIETRETPIMLGVFLFLLE